MHLIQSQVINITDSQKKRINSIFTAEKIIDISKGLSNEKIQDSVIKVRDTQIKELENKIELLKKEHTETLIEIAKNNKKAEETTKIVDDISDEELKKERLKWSGLHLYAVVEIPKMELNNTIFNVELMYELKRVHFGIKSDFGSVPSLDKSKYNFNYHLTVKYKFF